MGYVIMCVELFFFGLVVIVYVDILIWVIFEFDK